MLPSPDALKARKRSLRPVRPNAGIESEYRRRLKDLLRVLEQQAIAAVRAAWLRVYPEIAADAAPTSVLLQQAGELGRKWEAALEQGAPALAAYFADAATERVSSQLTRILRDARISVTPTLTPAMRAVKEAVISENVALIKSIPQQNLKDVEVLVAQSVARGRDLAGLVKELQARFAVSRKRAELIARDQNNKATAMLARARQLELGITQAVWMHSSAGKTPRPKHVAFAAGADGGPVFDLEKGAYIDGEWILPGQLINCKCTSRPLLPNQNAIGEKTKPRLIAS